MKKSWLFLDFDNTLMGTEQFGVPTLIQRFNELYGHLISQPLTLAEFKQHFHGQARETLCENLSKHFNIQVDYPTLYDAREWRMMQYLQALPEGVPMAPHLIQALSHLVSQDTILSFVSNNPIQRAMTAMRFAANGQGDILAHFFNTRFFEAGEAQKPKPDVYLRAMAQVAADPKKSFAVEDSISGAAAAVNAGLNTFGFTGFADSPQDMKKKLLEKGCIDVFYDWQEFPSLYNKHIKA